MDGNCALKVWDNQEPSQSLILLDATFTFFFQELKGYFFVLFFVGVGE